MAEPNARLSGVKQELSIFKFDFSSSFEKLRDSVIVKFSDINARLDEIEKNIKKISYRGKLMRDQEHNHLSSQRRKSKTP